ncbi:MAG: ankyrin repeat domain-containing protein [Verrucomicrobiaceae bacterium]
MKAPPIFAPTFHGDVVRVRELLEADPELISARNAKDLTPLHVAASRGQAEVVQVLLDYGADVHGPTEKGEWTPIVYAAYRGHLEAVEILVENGAGVTEGDGNPIHFAGQRRHREICRLLVEHGAVDDLVVSTDVDQLRLFRAAYGYDADLVEEILTRRPTLVEARDRNGRTPLHEACTNGDIKTVRVLLKYGANVEALDRRKERPLDRALAHRQHAVAKLLKKE